MRECWIERFGWTVLLCLGTKYSCWFPGCRGCTLKVVQYRLCFLLLLFVLSSYVIFIFVQYEAINCFEKKWSVPMSKSLQHHWGETSCGNRHIHISMATETKRPYAGVSFIHFTILYIRTECVDVSLWLCILLSWQLINDNCLRRTTDGCEFAPGMRQRTMTTWERCANAWEKMRQCTLGCANERNYVVLLDRDVNMALTVNNS